jgi:hypothetical protein
VPFDHTPTREWDDGIDAAIKILPYCQGVEYLFWWISPDRKDTRLTYLLSNMRPKRLDADFTNLLGTQTDFSLPFFDNITHLVVSNAPPNWTAIWAVPRLSHLLIDWIQKYIMPDDSDLLKVAADALSHCKTLDVCAIRYASGRGPNLDATLQELQDDRLVFIIGWTEWVTDLLSFAKGKPDTWVHAEAAVAKQKQGGRVEPIFC